MPGYSTIVELIPGSTIPGIFQLTQAHLLKFVENMLRGTAAL